MRTRQIVIIGFLVGALAAAGASAWAQGMTAPIPTGPIHFDALRLNSTSPAAAPPAPRRAPTVLAQAPARNLDIKAFFGAFAGNGLADGADNAYFGVTPRDLDVRISAAGDGGFAVAWTTVLRAGGDAQNPTIRRRETTLNFKPGMRPGIFQATDNGDPLAGKMLSWARINRNTLMVYQFDIQDDGRHEIQTYSRTLSGSGMDLVYTRIVDGEQQRRVRGKLVKNAN